MAAGSLVGGGTDAGMLGGGRVGEKNRISSTA